MTDMEGATAPETVPYTQTVVLEPDEDDPQHRYALNRASPPLIGAF